MDLNKKMTVAQFLETADQITRAAQALRELGIGAVRPEYPTPPATVTHFAPQALTNKGVSNWSPEEQAARDALRAQRQTQANMTTPDEAIPDGLVKQ